MLMMEARLSDLEARLRSLEPLLAVVSQPPLVAAEPPSLARSLASASSPPTYPVQPGAQGGWVTVRRGHSATLKKLLGFLLIVVTVICVIQYNMFQFVLIPNF